MRKANLDQNCEQINPLNDSLVQLHERWKNRLVFPFTELGKRYLRQDYSIVLDCSTSQSPFGISDRFSLVASSNRTHNINTCTRRKEEVRASANNYELPVLVESIHIVDDAERVIPSIAPSLVWLHIFDTLEDFGFRDSLYFSVVNARFIFRAGKLPENRKFDGIFMLLPVGVAGEMPDDVVETRTQVVNDLAAQDAPTQRKLEASVIVNRILPFLRVWIGNDWIFASFKEDSDFAIKVDDILVGPI